MTSALRFPSFIVLMLLTVVLGFLSLPPLERRSPAMAKLETVPQRVTIIGYDRSSHFGSWSVPTGQSCTTRQLLLITRLEDVVLQSTDSCQVASGHGIDPYTGQRLEVIAGDARELEIDHIFPLAAAWDLGAHSWPQETREAFANDPANLLVVSQTANREKSDQLPGHWLPPARNFRCRYANQMAEIAVKYGLKITESDLNSMHKQCLLR